MKAWFRFRFQAYSESLIPIPIPGLLQMFDSDSDSRTFPNVWLQFRFRFQSKVQWFRNRFRFRNRNRASLIRSWIRLCNWNCNVIDLTVYDHVSWLWTCSRDKKVNPWQFTAKGYRFVVLHAFLISAHAQEQVEWAVEEGADFILAETYQLLSEAFIALESIKKYGKGKSKAVHYDRAPCHQVCGIKFPNFFRIFQYLPALTWSKNVLTVASIPLRVGLTSWLIMKCH